MSQVDYDSIIAERARYFAQAQQEPQIKPSIIISEVSLWNTTLLQSETGTYPKWIELENVTGTPQELTNWRLGYSTTDNESFQFSPFPQMEIPPHSFLLLAFTPEAEILPVPSVRIKAELPENLLKIELFDSSSQLADAFELKDTTQSENFTEPKEKDYSLIRAQYSPSIIIKASNPTPGLSNTTRIPIPEFTEASGFHKSPEIKFDISQLPEGYTIRYTMNDGLDFLADKITTPRSWIYPNQISGYLYEKPVSLNKTAVIKARVYSPTGACSETVSRTFFVGEKTSLPIIALTIDPYDLWDPEWGIYTIGGDMENPNYVEKAYRLGKFEFFPDTNSISPYISETYMLRLYGSSSKAFPSKSFAIYAKEPGAADRIPNLFFSGSAAEIEDFYSLVLRNSGGDFYRTMFRDLFMTSLAAPQTLEKQDGQPSVVFINGQYWGILNIREKINEEFLKDHAGINPNGVDIVEGSYKDSMRINEGGSASFDELYTLLRNADPKYDYFYNQFSQLIDIDNFIDYVILQTFINNTDWPWSNVKFWRNREGDGKWRFILYDTDAGFDTSEYWTKLLTDPDDPKGIVDFNTIEYISNGSNSDIISKLFEALIRNTAFRNSFIERYETALQEDLSTEKLLEKIAIHEQNITDEIARHTRRWSEFDLETHSLNVFTKENWEKEVAVLRDFAKSRPSIVEEQLAVFQIKHPVLEAFRIENGDFETVQQTQWNLGWSKAAVSQSIIVLEDNSLGYFKIVEQKTHPWDSVAFVHDDIFIKEQENIELSFDIRANKNFTGSEYIRIILFDALTNREILSRDIKASSEWKKVTLKAKNTGPTLSHARLQFRVGTLRLGREVYIDNVFLEGEDT